MRSSNKTARKPKLKDNPSPRHSPKEEAVAETLRRELGVSFEAALQGGMGPCEALAAILSWVSCEMGRAEVPKDGR
jgi:hypothetical protein